MCLGMHKDGDGKHVKLNHIVLFDSFYQFADRLRWQLIGSKLYKYFIVRLNLVFHHFQISISCCRIKNGSWPFISKTRNEKRETRNEKRETRNEKRETRNEKRETRNEKLADGGDVYVIELYADWLIFVLAAKKSERCPILKIVKFSRSEK